MGKENHKAAKGHHGVEETTEPVAPVKHVEPVSEEPATADPIAEETVESSVEASEPEIIAPERIWSPAEIAAAEAVHKVSTR